MFGYIRPIKAECENYLFKSQYCSICKALGERFGQTSRYFISYDITLLSLVLSAFSEKEYVYKYENCVIHPLKKRRIKKRTEIECFAADLTIILFRNKFLDQIRDEKGINKAVFRSFYKLTSGLDRKIRYKELNILNDLLDDLYELETVKKSMDADEVSNVFGHIVKRVMQIASEVLDLSMPESVYEFSFLLGKWIYLMDAFEDLKKDLRKWRYNPLLLSNRDLLLDEPEQDELVKKIVDNEKWRMNLILDHMYCCFMRFEKDLGVYNYEIDGIISRAIPMMTDRILDKALIEPSRMLNKDK